MKEIILENCIKVFLIISDVYFLKSFVAGGLIFGNLGFFLGLAMQSKKKL